MLTIWTNKIKHSTVGSSFSVTFSVAPNELEYLNKLYDCFSSMNWSSFPITADRKTEPIDKDINVRSKTEPQTDTDFTLTYTCSFSDCENFKHFGFGEKCIECKRKQSKAMRKTEPQTDCSWK